MGDVSVSFVVCDDELVDLPDAYISKLPERLKDASIPHVRNNKGKKFFCYIEKELVNWNPNEPVAVLTWVDQCINKTLLKIFNESTDWRNEYKGEFINYWLGTTAYITSTANNASFIEAEIITGANTRKKEYLIFDDESVKNKWLLSREASNVSTSLSTVIVNFHNPHVPSNIHLPPKTLKNLFEFIKQVNPNSLNQIAQGLLDKIKIAPKHQLKKTINLCIILNTSDGLIGCEVGYRNSIKKALSSGKKTKKTSKYLPILSSQLHINEFRVLECKNALEDFVISRNLTSNKTLQGKKIALIGGGTIGGYTGQGLVQIGAGSGEGGKLDIYDDDTFEPHNLGRHLLSASYLGWFKADALCNELLAQYPHKITINTCKKRFTKKDLLTVRYDLVIDTTGSVPFSRMLRVWGRDLTRTYSPPIFIHGWNAGFGAAARVLIDDGKVCYSCVNCDDTGVKRFPVFRKGREPKGLVHNRKCGSIFSAYNSAISLMCAGLIQEAVFCVLNRKKWNFAQQTMDANVQHYSKKIITPIKSCTCNG